MGAASFSNSAALRLGGAEGGGAGVAAGGGAGGSAAKAARDPLSINNK